MPTLNFENLQFHFEPNIDASKYDKTRHYQNVVMPRGAMRAVDCTAVRHGQSPQRAWMIEVKDFRNLHGPPKDATPTAMIEDFRKKIADSRQGLQDASQNAEDDMERSHALRFLSAVECQVVLHLEPYQGPHTKLLPDPTANILQKLRKLRPAGDPTPLVLNIATTRRAGVPWSVA
jgi:hypothetical protein